MNNKYIIKVAHPLLRPGLTIETEASEKYVLPVVGRLMDMVRNINVDMDADSEVIGRNVLERLEGRDATS